MKNFSVGLDLRKLNINRLPELGRHEFSLGRYKLYLLAVCYVVGIAIGAMSMRSSDTSHFSGVGASAVAFFDYRLNGNFFTVFLSSVLAALPYLAASFCLGLFVLGDAAIPLVLVFKGMGYGATAGYLYAAYGFGGMAMNAAILFPSAVLSTLVLLLGFREALSFSALLFSGTILGKQVSIAPNFRLYCFRFLIILGLLIIPSLLDALFSVMFIGRFNF